jgi:hypothetical protein
MRRQTRAERRAAFRQSYNANTRPSSTAGHTGLCALTGFKQINVPPLQPSSIELRIGEVVLHGFQLRDRWPIGKALHAELTRLLEAHGAPDGLARGVMVERADGGSFHLPPGTKPAAVGVQIAGMVYRASVQESRR